MRSGERGWVPIQPDGLVMWTGAAWNRRAAMDYVILSFHEPKPQTWPEWRVAWRRMYRKGWRMKRCCLEQRTDT